MMTSSNHQVWFASHLLRRNRASGSRGFSLIEAVLSIGLLSITILPLVLLQSQKAILSRTNYVESSRMLHMSYYTDEMDPDRPSYSSLFVDSSMNAGLSESGQVIPYVRKPDTANSDAFNRIIHFYQYQNATDSLTSPRSKVAFTHNAQEVRIRCGNTADFMDSAGLYWYGDAYTYDSTLKRPGYVTGSHSGVLGASPGIADIINTQDDALFQSYREASGAGNNIDYSFNVRNGAYTVKLYFAEVSAAVTGSAPNRRLIDIYIEGALQNSSGFSPFETTGGANRATYLIYDVTVSDNVLNISIRPNAGTGAGYFPRVSAIAVEKRAS